MLTNVNDLQGIMISPITYCWSLLLRIIDHRSTICSINRHSKRYQL